MEDLIKINEGQKWERTIIELPDFNKTGLTPIIIVYILQEITNYLLSKLKNKIKEDIKISFELKKSKEFTETTKNTIVNNEKSYARTIFSILTKSNGYPCTKHDNDKVYFVYYTLVYNSLQNLNYKISEKKISQRLFCQMFGIYEPRLSKYKKIVESNNFNCVLGQIENLLL